MITKEQALTENEFHSNGCLRVIGPKGGEKDHVERWRRSGQTKTWQTRKGEWSIPIKFGLNHSARLTNFNDEHFHVVSECPLNHPKGPCPYCSVSGCPIFDNTKYGMIRSSDQLVQVSLANMEVTIL